MNRDRMTREKKEKEREGQWWKSKKKQVYYLLMWGRLKERDVVHLYYCGSATSTVMLGGKSMVEVGLSDVLTFALIY